MTNTVLVQKFIDVMDKFTAYIDAQTVFANEQSKIIKSLYEVLLQTKQPELYKQIKKEGDTT